MNLPLIEEVANAVLYEGYLLYPYRASAVKNRQRWNFGVLSPPDYARVQGDADGAHMRIECLARGGRLGVQVRFLQLIARETLNAQGETIERWEEAIEREVRVDAASLEALAERSLQKVFAFDAGVEGESEQVVRRREALAGIVEVSAEAVDFGWFRLRLSIENRGTFRGRDRAGALLRSFVSTHAILTLADGEFASLLDAPCELKQAAAACKNVGAYPVLAGDPGSTDAMLCSPVILYDYPQIAPESAGALFDGTEIDEILSLRILTMTGEEKQEMREVDDFARRILERTEALTPEQFMKMHGTLRQSDGGKP